MKLQIKSWAMFLNLQVGVLFMSVGFMTMSFNVMIVTLKGHPEINDHYEYNAGVYSYVLIVLLTWFIAFMGAYLQNRHLIFAAIVLWTLFIVFWLCAVLLSHFFMEFGSSLCVDQRCAVSMWLFSNRHYDVFHDKIDYFYHSPHDAVKDAPVRDPFAIYDMTDSYDKVDAISQKDARNTELITAVLVLAICSISTISTDAR